MATNTYVPIGTTTLASSSTSVNFFGIPTQDVNGNALKDLVLVVEVLGNASSAANALVTFNTDTGSNYFYALMQGNGTTASTSSGTSTSISGYGSDGTTKALSKFEILDYTATDKHKTVIVRANRPDAIVQARAARWANTSAIGTITITDNLGNGFAAGSTFSLYGIAG